MSQTSDKSPIGSSPSDSTNETLIGVFHDDPPEDAPIYTPHPNEAQLTVRAVLAGSLLGSIVAAMNIYIGLRIGWSMGASILAAILGYSFFHTFSSKKLSPLETNIAQTCGSAAGSMSSAAGLLAPIPALAMLGTELNFWQLVLWAGSVAWLGVFFAVPLRRQMVLVEKLRFPSGTATAETISALYSTGEEAEAKSKTLVNWAIAAALFTLIASSFPVLEHPPIIEKLHETLGWSFLGFFATYGFVIYLSPVMTAAGILVGMRIAISLLVGAVFCWGILAPWVNGEGLVENLESPFSYEGGAISWCLWPGVALMITDALAGLLLQWRSVLGALGFNVTPKEESEDSEGSHIGEKSGTTTTKQAHLKDLDQDDMIPNSWWIGGLIVASILCIISTNYLFEIPVLYSIIAIALSSVLSAIAVRSTGETDINPVGGMGKVTQLAFGAIAPAQVATNLMSAAITGSGASQAGDMMQDLKTGYLLGASPRKQLLSQLCGIFFGIFSSAGAYYIFSQSYDIGNTEDKFPAPAAHAWKAMAELLSKGIDTLPKGAIQAVVIASIIGVLLPVVRNLLPKEYKNWVPSGLAIGIAFIVKPIYSIAMFVGAVLYALWEKRDSKKAKMLGLAIASGVLAGEGLMGVAIAAAKILGILE